MNPNFNLGGDWAIPLLLAAVIAWILTLLGVILAVRLKQDPVTKFMWVFIVVTMPIIGFFLLMMIGPPPQRQQRPER